MTMADGGFSFSKVPQIDSLKTPAHATSREHNVPFRVPAPARKAVPTSRDRLSATSSEDERMLTETRDKEFVTSLGRPVRKGSINWVDALATLLSMLCLIGAIVVVNPSFSYSAYLGYTEQIIVVGFLLGIMTQCMLRTVPHAFLLIEARYGQSTLQNFDGLLRWTPLADNMGVIWTVLLGVLLLLPLGLSIGYKRYTGGIGSTGSVTTVVEFGTSSPPGTQSTGVLNQMVNATLPFMAATTTNETLPEFGTGSGQVYGYNLALFSVTEAAALDIPLSETVLSIQAELGSGELAIVSADVRGTMARHHPLSNTSIDWEDAWTYGDWSASNLWGDEYYLGFLAVSGPKDDDPRSWNSSWVFLGAFNESVANNVSENAIAFQQAARLFTLSRVGCHATWNITTGSILLAAARCGDELWKGYQFYTSCQLAIAERVPSLLPEYLAPFTTFRKGSPWELSTYVMSVASSYQSRMASSLGSVPVQVNGSIYQDWALATNSTAASPLNLTSGLYQETYNSTLTKSIQRPVLRSDWLLYGLLAIQPFLTVLGIVTIYLLRRVPLAHGFGLISVLAGVDKDGLDILAGATLSGQTKKAVSMQVDVVEDVNPSNGTLTRRLRYSLGRLGLAHPLVDTKLKYY
ncbi:hypothetical protein CLAIMM_13793 [Cladophialophora immunda]|nr:hypothetical protein CLAIMM_13793 [Cladophialophora immunda]